MHSLRSLSEIKNEFDGFILDLWGLIHDGVKLYPNVLKTFKALKDNGIRTVLLSNAPRRSYLLIDGLTDMGIARNLYGGVLSSGEVTWQEFMDRKDPAFSNIGNSVYHIGPQRDVSVIEGTGITIKKRLDECDFILNTGPVELEHELNDYKLILSEALVLKLPMVCANPDKVVVRDGQKVICAGMIAGYYEEIGGKVIYRGKPDPSVYDYAVSMLDVSNRERVAIIGDSLDTDIAGANASNIKSIWCTGGIHAKELEINYGDVVSQNLSMRLIEKYGFFPWATIPGFYW